MNSPNVATKILSRFRSQAALARHLDLTPAALSHWKRSGFIPADKQQAVLDAAPTFGVTLTPADFFSHDAS